MRVISTIFLMIVSAHAALANPSEYILKSPALNVVIDFNTGGISQIYDLYRPESPQVFETGDAIFTIAAGDFEPCQFEVSSYDSTSITLISPDFYFDSAQLPLRTVVTYKLFDDRITIDYSFEALGQFELDRGLDINISSSSWERIDIKNHYSGEDSIVLNHTSIVRRMGLNQVYEFRNHLRDLCLVYYNPYHSLITISTTPPQLLQFSWHVLYACEPFLAIEPKGPRLASVLIPGIHLHRQIALIIGHEDDTKHPLAYFSPFPHGYDQVIAMTLDDIPFGTYRIPKSGHDPDAPLQQYLIRLLEDHPKMRMGWIILPDAIFSESAIVNQDYPPGKWWRAHGISRLATCAPPEYLQWLRNIERDSLVHGYEDQIHLGNHGYHHAPEMKFGWNFEFQHYDPEVNDSTFAAIVRDYGLMGLGSKSLKWIRFPGFKFSRATVDALIKNSFKLFDYWGVSRLPWMLFYSEHGRIWAGVTLWEGDSPSSYEVMDKVLRSGKLCYTSGHPRQYFDGDYETAYQEIHGIFQQAEDNFPNLGYMFPDDVGFFVDETYDIHDIKTEFEADNFVISFTGSATLGQTIMAEWPYSITTPFTVTINKERSTDLEIRGNRLIIQLPTLQNGTHIVRGSTTQEIPPEKYIPPFDIALFQNHPNPFMSSTTIRYWLPYPGRVKVTIYNLMGQQITVIVDKDQQSGLKSTQWDGRNRDGRRVASGIYFCRLEVGSSSSVRKLNLVR